MDMTKLPGSDVLAQDRIRLALNFDAPRMQAEVHALNLGTFIYYDVAPLRAPAHLVDPSIATPTSAVDDYADGSWTEWLDTRALKESPYLTEVVDTFRAHTRVTLVRLLRLEAGAVVKEHNDPTLALEQQKSVIRLTIPIQSNHRVVFFLNRVTVPMLPGECWYLRLSDPHSIVNAGDSERINMTIDMLPNNWVKSLLLPSQ
jgi:hypothetical protein